MNPSLPVTPAPVTPASVRVMACRRTGNKVIIWTNVDQDILHDMASLGHNRLKDGMGVTLLIILSDFTLVFVWSPEQKSTREYIRRTYGSFNCIRLTHWGRLKNAAMLKTFSNSLSCMKFVFVLFLFKFNWNLVESWINNMTLTEIFYWGHRWPFITDIKWCIWYSALRISIKTVIHCINKHTKTVDGIYTLGKIKGMWHSKIWQQ